MRRAAVLTILALAAAAAGPVAPGTQTAGLERLPLRVTNAAAGPIACAAQIAHWFAMPLADIAPGATAEIALWRHPESGTVMILNARGEALPVERIWCGHAGRAWQTRAQIAIDRSRPAAPIALSCGAGDERLVCLPHAHRP
ncbi:MAG: hypothetical protein KatS3mg118_1996 [Paracoccaceae bacterium]|nr:MAG: hypothetical protein KatS3mg118_1996 [Paracoccaceae bacterium]